MRAALVREVPSDVVAVVDDVELDAVGPHDVVVDIVATGVCHSDLHSMHGDLPQGAPFVPGHEGAGIVAEVGSAVDHVAVGDHMIVAWSPPCGRCVQCVDQRQPHLCVQIQFATASVPRFRHGGTPIYGMAGTGTWAERLVVPHQACVVIDDDVPFEIASLIGCGVTTGVGAALNTARVEPGSTCVVFGCGGVGVSVIQGCRVAGAATIVAVDLNEAKLDLATRFGATHGCLPDGLRRVQREVTGAGGGFDFAFEAIGRPETVRAAYDATRRGGTVTVVGAGRSTATVAFDMFELFFDEKTIKGSYYGSADVRSDFARFLRLWRAGRLDLEGMITARTDLAGVNDAIAAMARGETIRTVVTP